MRWLHAANVTRRTTFELAENLASTAWTKVSPLTGKRLIPALAAPRIIELNAGPVRQQLGLFGSGKRTG